MPDQKPLYQSKKITWKITLHPQMPTHSDVTIFPRSLDSYVEAAIDLLAPPQQDDELYRVERANRYYRASSVDIKLTEIDLRAEWDPPGPEVPGLLTVEYQRRIDGFDYYNIRLRADYKGPRETINRTVLEGEAECEITHRSMAEYIDAIQQDARERAGLTA